MKAGSLLSHPLRLLSLIILISLTHRTLLAGDNNQINGCIDMAIEKILKIRSLPEKKYLKTLDDQVVLLQEFNTKCLKLFPYCTLFEKFYYLPNEVRELISKSENGMTRHKIRCYHNCLSAFCPEKCDPQKIHGDVAEFYDDQGRFMGLSVYMGEGQYCPLPFDGYPAKLGQ